MSTHRQLCLVASLLLAGCSSSSPKPDGPLEDAREHMEVVAYNPDAKLETSSLGSYLVGLDRSIQVWNGLFLSGDQERDALKLRSLSVDIGYRTRKLFYELVDELENSQAVNNRRVVAAALGFVQQPEAMSPLLNALSDPDLEVRTNALLGLGILGDPKTPTAGITEQMRSGLTERIRSNAALALLEILRAGGTADPDLLEAARAGLHDTEPLVRTQCALILAHQLDTESIDDLALQLFSDDVNSAAMAAGRAIAYLGSRDSHVKGRCARALTASLGRVNSLVKRSVLNDLRKLSSMNFAEEEDWVEWAHRLD